MTTLTEALHPNESFVSEAAGERSREAITVASGLNVTACMVLGAAYGAATAAAKAGGNTGNGTFTIDATTPTLAGAKPGVYRLRCIAIASNNGTFRLEDPDGIVLGDTVMAAGAGAVSEHIKGALADGSTDFAVGDGFDITVPATRTFGPLNLSSVVGYNIAAGIAYGDYNGTDAAVRGVAYVRDCEHNADLVKWPSGINDTQKALATSQLAALGIILR